MSTEWISILTEQGDLAKRMARDVPIALGHPKLTLDQASRLHNAVEDGAQKFDQVVLAMEQEDLDDALLEAAEALEDIWSGLCIATANKVRTMQGLAPIELSEDD